VNTWWDNYIQHKFVENVLPLQEIEQPLLALFIGCNKGDDAVETLAKLTGDIKVDKYVFNKQLMAAAEARGQLLKGRACPDEEDDRLLRHHALGNNRVGKAVVHCIEAMPSTAKLLHAAAKNLTWLAASGRFHVEHAALARNSKVSKILFPNSKPGMENLGLSACKSPKGRKNCVSVPVYTMDSYVKAKVVGHDQKFSEETLVIDFLSVDVEGNDWEVLGYGGATWTLAHSRYLEFEYHRIPPWNQVNLSTAVASLEEQGFVCYYAGRQKLWRLTGCFQEFMNYHSWSNVACANGALDPELAAQMEAVFMQTITS
jgi:FkbM family methyltransferase